jgi:hypothetical protein
MLRKIGRYAPKISSSTDILETIIIETKLYRIYQVMLPKSNTIFFEK